MIARGWALARAVYQRHATRYLTVSLTVPAPIRAHWVAGRLEVAVFGATGLISLSLGNARCTALPDALGEATLSIRAPLGAGGAVLSGQGWAHTIALPTRHQMRRARAVHAAGFARQLVSALPAGLAVLRNRHDPARLIALRQAIGLSRVSVAADLDGARLAPATTPPQPAPDRPVTLILPVYNAFDLLPEALNRIEAHTDLAYRLIVIEDASGDPEIRPWLRARLDQFPPGTAQLIENEQNLGFVKSANIGLAIAQKAGGHAVLLNTDSFVPQAWASRLLGPIAGDASVASVTPWSGASGLTTVPAIGPGSPLPPGVADQLDRIAWGQSGPRCAPVPTGMGFCMALNARFLHQIPQLDEIFGAGYGEETDWCQRATAHGGRHVAHLGLFVDHRGSASFGSANRDRLAAEAAAILRARYPRYEADVARFVDHDPLLTERLALGIASLGVRAGAAPVPVYLAHSLGGGAEFDLTSRLADDAKTGVGAIVLRVGGHRRWRLEVHGASHAPVAGVTDDAALMGRLLASLPRRRIVYSCAVGAPDPLAVPDLLLALLTGPDDRLEVLLHDYFPISPSFTLLDADGWFRGLPSEDTTDPAHLAQDRNGRPVPLSAWRKGWQRLIARADSIVAFSAPSADLLRATWPDLSGAITVQPHARTPLQPVVSDGQVIGILGNINLHKGARVVEALARACPDRRMVVLGTFDLGQPIPPNLKVLGPYERAEIGQIAAQEKIGAWLIPSIWPETFCFTVHEALATGMPVFGFDLGAQGAALREARASGMPGYALAAGDTPKAAAKSVEDAFKTVLR